MLVRDALTARAEVAYVRSFSLRIDYLVEHQHRLHWASKWAGAMFDCARYHSVATHLERTCPSPASVVGASVAQRG